MHVIIFLIIPPMEFICVELLSVTGNAVQGTDGLNQVQLQVVEFLCDNSFGKQAPPIAACRKALRTIFLHYDSNEVCSRNVWFSGLPDFIA